MNAKIELKKCRTIVSYFSEKLQDITSSVYVCEQNNLCYIQNSFEKIWIEKSKLTIVD
jgi:hypothetical protein